MGEIQIIKELMMFHLSLITSHEELFSDLVQKAVFPGVEGVFELLPNHMPFMCNLSTGDIHINTQGTTHTYTIQEGVLYFLNNQCDVLIKKT
jgi:F-type H+-transporting ATPase subunit epsilon